MSAAADEGEAHPSGFRISLYVPPPRRTSVGKPRRDDAKRKARFYLAPPEPNESTPHRRRQSERKRYEWSVTPIPAGVTNAEVARWMWQEGQQDCVLCERPIDIETTAKQHPGRIELDHIIQRAWGGTHTWGNVRPVHRGCNQFRGGGNGTGFEYLPQQFRRSFDHSLDYYMAPDKPRAKMRRVWIRWIEQHRRLVEWWELDLAEAKSDEERDQATKAIAWNQAEADRHQTELDQIDRDLAAWDERRRVASEDAS